MHELVERAHRRHAIEPRAIGTDVRGRHSASKSYYQRDFPASILVQLRTTADQMSIWQTSDGRDAEPGACTKRFHEGCLLLVFENTIFIIQKYNETGLK